MRGRPTTASRGLRGNPSGRVVGSGNTGRPGGQYGNKNAAGGGTFVVKAGPSKGRTTKSVSKINSRSWFKKEFGMSMAQWKRENSGFVPASLRRK